MNYNKTTLQNAINKVNTRFAKGLNDDDTVFNMIHIAQYTKGYYIKTNFDTYSIYTDLEHLEHLVNNFGYWNAIVAKFNEILKIKGGYDYMVKLNNKVRK
jgi:hypothetical protein